MAMTNQIPKDLLLAKTLIFDSCGMVISDFKMEPKNNYQACSFLLNHQKVHYRTAKITPTKTGQFVAIWTRNEKGTTSPIHIYDQIDFLIITTRRENHIGQFVFPVSALLQNKIISTASQEGKRGMRVYPPWDIALNKQAQKRNNGSENTFSRSMSS
jgi:hypothetical protein